jgi:hypothetical protein
MKHHSLLLLQIILLLAEDYIAHAGHILASRIITLFESYVIGDFLPWASLDYISSYVVLVLGLKIIGILSVKHPISLNLLRLLVLILL